MQVVAMQKGFYGGRLRRIGDVFEMDDKGVKKDKDGNVVKPKWVKAAANAGEARALAKAAKAADIKKQVDGARAASGGAAAKAKADAMDAGDLAG